MGPSPGKNLLRKPDAIYSPSLRRKKTCPVRFCEKGHNWPDKRDLASIERQQNGFYQSRLAIEISMWEKGEAIDAEFRGVKSAKSYYQLERETTRQRERLKVWHAAAGLTGCIGQPGCSLKSLTPSKNPRPRGENRRVF
jgi:hypothetical protein